MTEEDRGEKASGTPGHRRDSTPFDFRSLSETFLERPEDFSSGKVDPSNGGLPPKVTSVAIANDVVNTLRNHFSDDPSLIERFIHSIDTVLDDFDRARAHTTRPTPPVSAPASAPTGPGPPRPESAAREAPAPLSEAVVDKRLRLAYDGHAEADSLIHFAGLLKMVRDSGLYDSRWCDKSDLLRLFDYHRDRGAGGLTYKVFLDYLASVAKQLNIDPQTVRVKVVEGCRDAIEAHLNKKRVREGVPAASRVDAGGGAFEGFRKADAHREARRRLTTAAFKSIENERERFTSQSRQMSTEDLAGKDTDDGKKALKRRQTVIAKPSKQTASGPDNTRFQKRPDLLSQIQENLDSLDKRMNWGPESTSEKAGDETSGGHAGD